MCMSLLNTRSQYGAVSWTLHWIIVLALLAQWLLSEADEDSVPVPGLQLNALTLHQSIGLAVLLLAIVRLAWPGSRIAMDRPIARGVKSIVH